MFTWLAVRLICRPRLNAPRFMNDGPKEFDHRALIQWPFIGFTHSLNHLALAGMIAEMHARSSFRLAHLKRELRALVQQPEQLAVKHIYFSSPVFDAHRVTPCDVRSRLRPATKSYWAGLQTNLPELSLNFGSQYKSRPQSRYGACGWLNDFRCV